MPQRQPSNQSPGGQLSNLEQFLERTTPTVTPQFLSKTFLRGASLKKGWPACPTESIYFFSLGDLWDSFDEWSAYGAGVPIALDGKDTVVQYYVPYLSALQLYAGSSMCVNNSSDFDLRDTSSESSSDGETDTQLYYGNMLQRGGFQKTCADPNSISCQNLRVGKSIPKSIQVTREMFAMAGYEPWCEQNQPGCLLFEFFERSAPSVRVPLFDKIAELACTFPALRTLNNIDLFPSSWLSVAWYPIYQIPTGPTLKDLAACFLTYHFFSTFPVENGGISSFLQEELQPSTCTESSKKISLQPFGLACYKFRGTIWIPPDISNLQQVTFLQRSADSWLKRLHVQHPDYEYFLSRSPSMRH